VRPHSQGQGPGRSSPGVRFPFRAELRLGCPRSGNRRDRLRGLAVPVEPGNRLSWGSCSPSALLRRVPPCRTHHDRSTREGRETAAGKVKAAKPTPVPSSGFLPLSTVLAALAARTLDTPRGISIAVRRGAPTLRGLVSCRSRPRESSCRAFPSRGAVPALAGRVLPCGFMLTAQRRGPSRGLRGSFRRSRRPPAAADPKARRTEVAGTTVPRSR